MKTIIKGEFKLTGINKIDIDLVIRKWNHLWWLAEWKGGDWRLIKYLRKDSGITEIKLIISEEQAKELIEKLSLVSENGGFSSAFNWRRQSDIDSLNAWRITKYLNRIKQ